MILTNWMLPVYICCVQIMVINWIEIIQFSVLVICQQKTGVSAHAHMNDYRLCMFVRFEIPQFVRIRRIKRKSEIRECSIGLRLKKFQKQYKVVFMSCYVKFAQLIENRLTMRKHKRQQIVVFLLFFPVCSLCFSVFASCCVWAFFFFFAVIFLLLSATNMMIIIKWTNALCAERLNIH